MQLVSVLSRFTMLPKVKKTKKEYDNKRALQT